MAGEVPGNTLIPCSPPIGGFWTWDVPRNRVAGCPSLFNFFGFGEQERAAGLPLEAFLDRIISADRDRVLAAIAAAVSAHSGFCETYHIQTPDRGTHMVRAVGSCFYDSEGQPTFFPGWFIDVSGAGNTAKDEALHFAVHCLSHAQAIARSAGEEMLDYLLENLLVEFAAKRRGNHQDILRRPRS